MRNMIIVGIGCALAGCQLSAGVSGETTPFSSSGSGSEAEEQTSAGEGTATAENASPSGASEDSAATQEAAAQPGPAAGSVHATQTATLTPGFGMKLVHFRDAGGAVATDSRGTNCEGWASSAPDLTLRIDGQVQMQISGASGDDTTLIVSSPNGTVCTHGEGGESAAVLDASWPAGTYDVWVASRQQGATVRGHLTFSES
jgi:hypothetical protein